MIRALPPFRPRARTAVTLAHTLMEDVSHHSANTAWICRKTRPADAVVSMGEFGARNPMQGSLSVMSSPAPFQASRCLA